MGRAGIVDREEGDDDEEDDDEREGVTFGDRGGRSSSSSPNNEGKVTSTGVRNDAAASIYDDECEFLLFKALFVPVKS